LVVWPALSFECLPHDQSPLLSLAALALALSGAPAAAPLSAAAQRVETISQKAGTPEDTYGDLYRAVELARVFPDSKTFADMVPLDGPAAVLAAYKAENPQGRKR
jgi:alpha,alpha-trehalase